MLDALASGPSNGDPVGRIAWKLLVLIISANLVFGLLLGGLPTLEVPAMGLMIAIYALVSFRAFKSRREEAFVEE